MNASREQLAILRTVLRGLGPLADEVVLVGGVASALLVTSRGAAVPRPTHDVDLILEVASTVEYQTRLRDRLLARGFREDHEPEAPICRWRLGEIRVDVMPVAPNVLGFSNRWYEHALRTAKPILLPADAEGTVHVRLVTGPAFCATKLAAWKDPARGNGDLYHHDLEDLVAVVDGRIELLSEIEGEVDGLRTFLAEETSALFRAGLEEALAGHLPGDGASQSRLPRVRAALRRIARKPRLLRIGEQVRAAIAGDPGATGVPHGGAWDWEITGWEIAPSRPPPGRRHTVFSARLTSHSPMAGTSGDGRNVRVEDELGRLFPPLYERLDPERRRRQMPGCHDAILPQQPFETAWVFELPADLREFRLLLPFDHVELPFTLAA